MYFYLVQNPLDTQERVIYNLARKKEVLINEKNVYISSMIQIRFYNI